MTAERSPLASPIALTAIVAVTLALVYLNLAPLIETGNRLVLWYAFLPRLAIAALAGAALGLSGVLFQQLLQNPLAASDTLAVNAGAQLLLSLGILYLPVFHAENPQVLAIAGAFLAWGLVAVLAGRHGRDPMTLILTGFITTFALGSLASLIMLLNQEYLTTLLIWGAGSLAQTDWTGVRTLLIWLVVAAAATALLVRPLLLLGFGDQTAGSIGVSLRLVRPVLFILAILLSASVVATVGVIGFIGLAAPHLARVLGAQRLGGRLIIAPLAGAGLLVLVDQAVQVLSDDQAIAIPTGAVTALLGAPILILLLRRMPQISLERVALPLANRARRIERPAPTLIALALLGLAASVLALVVGRGPPGLAIDALNNPQVLDWRFPRVLGAAAAGLASGVAGCIVQRLFANPMASPEVLGIGGGVVVGLILALLASASASAGLQLTGAIAGGLTVAVFLAWFGRQRTFSPQRLLLVGIAITALMNAVTLLFLALGDGRIGQILAWLGGSTYRVTEAIAIPVAVLAFLATIAILPLARWLDILPLGEEAAASLGLPVRFVRIVALGVSTLAAAAATTIIGPLSFIGLIAPHIALTLGLRRAAEQIVGAGLSGIVLVVAADWVGRILFAPTELPAGLICVFLGAATYGLLALAKARGQTVKAR